MHRRIGYVFGLRSACVAEQPNIVVVVADDMGWDATPVYRVRTIHELQILIISIVMGLPALSFSANIEGEKKQ